MVSPRQLVRVGLDQYALLIYESIKPLWAFESKLFSRLLDALGEPIVDIEIYLSSPKSDYPEFSEFRLQLESGRQISVKKTGEFYEVSKLVFSGIENPGAVSIDERWNLDSVFPLDRMLVTNAFSAYLDFTFKSTSISDILTRVWTDFARLGTYCGQHTLEHQSFSSEFGDLTAVELSCGRVVFFAPEFEPVEEMEPDECF